MKPKELSMYEVFFTRQTFEHFRQGMQAYEKREYLSAAVWGAVFIEALLKDILAVMDIPHDGDDLNQMIVKLRKLSKDKTYPAEDRKEYSGIAKRCNEIREKRNRIVHDTGIDRGDICKDSDDIYGNNVQEIVKGYIKTGAAKQIEKENRERQRAEEPEELSADYPIFVSTITPHTVEQEQFIEAFCGRLRRIGVRPVRCGKDDYDKRDPFGKVCEKMEECHASIVIGLERCHSFLFRDKEGSAQESEGYHRIYSSAWLQIESGIAAGMKKQVFVLCQDTIFEEGIFDRGWNTYVPMVMQGPLDVNNKTVDDLLENVKKYMKTHNN